MWGRGAGEGVRCHGAKALGSAGWGGSGFCPGFPVLTCGPRVQVSWSFWVDSVHLNFSSVPLALVTGFVHSRAPPPSSCPPFSPSLVCRELDKA